MSEPELAAIDKARKAGKWRQAKLLEAQAKGRFVENELRTQFSNLGWSRTGADGIAYDIMSGTKSNIDRHAKRMANTTFRMIAF